MKRFKTIALTLILGSFVLLSCKKYPEDPFISLRKPIDRSTGVWQFTSYQINGVEHSHDFDSLFQKPQTLTDLAISFYLDRDAYYYFTQNGFNTTNIMESGEYGISTDNTTFWIGPVNSSGFPDAFYINVFKPIITGTKWTPTNWTIVELYGKHFHISNNGIDIYFKSVK